MDQRREDAEKRQVIEAIVMRLDGLPSPDRHNDDLKQMTVSELRLLAEGMKALRPGEDARAKVLGAITDSRDARRVEEERQMTKLGVGPAKVEMWG